ncbi:MAG: hypothetical protein ACJAZV_001612 [Roseivirga sp.]
MYELLRKINKQLTRLLILRQVTSEFISMRKLNIAFLILFTFACSDQKIDTKKAREGLKSQEIIVVSDANILEKAMEMGKQDLAIKRISVDENSNYQIELSDSTKFKSIKIFFPYEVENQLDGKSKEVFDAYVYNHDNALKSSPNVQFGEDKKFIIYTTPVEFEGKEVGVFLVKILRKEIVLSFAD